MTLTLLALAALAPPREARLIVQLVPGADPAAVGARARVTLRDVAPGAPFALYGTPSSGLLAAQARLQADTASVVWAEDDAALQNAEDVSKGSTVSVIGDPSDVAARNADALAQVGWSASLAASDGRTVRLALLDTGLSRRQPSLWAKVDASYDAFGGDADDAPMGIDSSGNRKPDEGVGHGTMVAGIANAVAPKARLVVAKVADSDGQATTWSVLKGIVFAVGQGAEVANVSLGSPDALAAFNDLAEWAESKGLLVVAPIGNAATSRSWYPARSSKALCVAGLKADDGKASFSNWDSAADGCAPAVGIVSLGWNGGLAAWSGTSFASPFVAAGLADVLRRTGRQTPRSLIRAVTDSGRDVDRVNKSYKGKLGTALNIMSLDRQLRGAP